MKSSKSISDETVINGCRTYVQDGEAKNRRALKADGANTAHYFKGTI